MIDAHCHLADPRFDATRDEVIAKARRRGIRAFIQGGVGPDDWDRQLELQQKYPEIHPAFGVHPWWVADHSDEECEDALGRLPSYLGKAVGLGELGLDFGPKMPEASHGRQRLVFRRQLEIARETGKPLILHIVKAHAEAIRMIRDIGLPDRGGIVHSFAAGREMAEAYLSLGLAVSLGGPVARKGFETLKRAVVFVPLDRIVIESDSPDQPPPAYAGGLNEPSSIYDVAAAVGELKRTDPARILNESCRTLERIFQIQTGEAVSK